MIEHFQINVRKAKNGYYEAEICGIKSKQSNDLNEVVSTLVQNLFKTRKQLTTLPDAYQSDKGREVLQSLNAFLPEPSRSTDWE